MPAADMLYWIEAHGGNPATSGRWGEDWSRGLESRTGVAHPAQCCFHACPPAAGPPSCRHDCLCCGHHTHASTHLTAAIQPLSRLAAGRWAKAHPEVAAVVEGKIPAVVDAPFWLHWGKAWLWLIMEAVIIAAAVLTNRNSDRWTAQLIQSGGPDCTVDTQMDCHKGGEDTGWVGVGAVVDAGLQVVAEELSCPQGRAAEQQQWRAGHLVAGDGG